MSAATDLRQATNPAFPVQPTRHPQVACSCCNAAVQPLQLMGSESQPPIRGPRQSLAGLISNVPEPRRVFSIFFSTLHPTTLDNDSPSAHPLTHPQFSIRHPPSAAAPQPARQTTAVALRSMFPASVASAVFSEESVAANAWLCPSTCACPARGTTPTSPSTPACGYLLRSLVYLHYPHVVGVDQSSPSPDTLSRCFCRAVGFW